MAFESHVRSLVREAGSTGISRSDLKRKLAESGGTTESQLSEVLFKLVEKLRVRIESKPKDIKMMIHGRESEVVENEQWIFPSTL